MNTAHLAEILKRRNVRKVCYFHTDHFEPWSRGVKNETVKGVEIFTKQTRQSRFAEKLSLFYHTFLPFQLDPRLVLQNKAGIDAVMLGNRSDEQNRLAREAMFPVERDGKHEIHIHIHHESWTRNTKEYSKEFSRWVNQNSTAEMDSSRLETGISLTKEYVANDIGRTIDKWAFVHGNWALNGSDRTICWIENEIELLMKHGCFGDFTFPAGRGHCDPAAVLEPYTCLPVTKPKGYDTPEAAPIRIRPNTPAFSQDRFFIWNSAIKADFSSIDYYDKGNRERFKDPITFVRAWLEKSVVIDDVLYIKTHAHSMNSEYAIEKGVNPIPHLYPDITAIFDLLEKVCEAVDVQLQTVTVNELMASLEKLTAPDRTEPPATIRMPLEACIDALAAAMTAWLDGSGERDYSAGEFYKVRIHGKRWLEDYELAAVKYILNHYDKETAVITEIGCGLGTLTFVLAALGYKVNGIEGDKRRADGANWLKDHAKSSYPSMARNYKIINGFYPDVLTSGLIEEGKTNVLISTNLIHTFSANNQERILRSALMFDKFIMDSSRFGVNRAQNNASSSIEHALSRHFARGEIIFTGGSASLVEYTVRDSLAASFEINCAALQKLPDVIKLTNAVSNEWITELHAQGAKDDFIEKKLSKQLIDHREISVCQQFCALFDPANTRVIEVGSACGALALLLAVQGYEVIGFEGNVRRCNGAQQLQTAWTAQYPTHPVTLNFVPQLFPKAYNDALVRTSKRTVLLSTNIVGTYSAENQSRLLAAAANFTDVVIDLGRFGLSRDSQEQRTALLHALATTHFEAVAPLYVNAPYEFWHLRVPAISIQSE
jgi:16S rRNA A1518/A1519 N6-dimethyltransferase RsmA/KsgA/DIM1 with predicted DNA glycosylase/AP lyase activity